MKAVFDWAEIVIWFGAAIPFALGYLFLRGAHLGKKDVLLFAFPAGFFVWISMYCFKMVSLGGGESDAYLRLLALLVMLVTIPLGVGFVTVFVAAFFKMILDAGLAKGTVIVVATMSLIFLLMVQSEKPSGARKEKADPEVNRERLEGEEWALETGATEEDCLRENKPALFKDGCLHQSKRQSR